MFIDTHTHLFYPNFEEDFDEVLKRAKENKVDFMLVPATDLETAKKSISLAEKYPQIYSAVGVHPHDTKDWNDEWIDVLRNLAKHEKVVAIGEIGLDYYYDFSPKKIQIDAFRKQLDLAIELNLPVVIHNRDSNEDVMNFAREYAKKGLKAQFHCFAGSKEDAKELVELGYFISFTGNITFKKSETLREIVKAVPLENILIETDSPFLSPAPHRGKRNEPSYIGLVAEVIAELHHVRVKDVARTTSYNTLKLFGFGKAPEKKFTYQIGKSLYINVTNRCNADCIFCTRKEEPVIFGYNLGMGKSEEPPAGIYINEIGDPKKYKEIVFCGYGEPTIRWDVVKQVATWVKENGGKTRMNTNGHGNLINKRDITPELKDTIDMISISLNSVEPKQYAKLMRVDESLHAEMLDFARKSKNYTLVVMSIVGLSEVDTQIARDFVKAELGVLFRERAYFS